MGKDLLSGDGFIFINKRRTLIKILVCLPAGQAGDRTEYVIYYKKLSSGTLELPDWEEKVESRLLELPTLLMMLEGVEITSAKLRKRYIKPEEKRA